MKRKITAILSVVLLALVQIHLTAWAEIAETGDAVFAERTAVEAVEEVTEQDFTEAVSPESSGEKLVSILGAAAPVTTQEELNAAADAAAAGDIIEIAAGTYTVPGIPNNITLKAASGAAVVFNCVGSGSICSIPNGVVFDGVTMNYGTENYHGFQHAGKITMNGCTLNGKFFSYGDMEFNGCTFNAPGTTESGSTSADYSMWCYGQDLTYTDCTFNGAGKFLNVYNEKAPEVPWNVVFDGCTFNSTKLNKAAINVKEYSGSNLLAFNVEIRDCTTTGLFPEVTDGPVSNGEGKYIYVIDPLVQVDDMNAQDPAEAAEASQ